MSNWQSSTNVTSGDALPLKIAGFGACMITGYPHKSGGLFDAACRFVEKDLSRSVQSHTVSLGGFPVARAEKYLQPRVLVFKPDYVVLQFGATDVHCPIRTKNGGGNRSFKSNVAFGKAAPEARAMVTHSGWEMPILKGMTRKTKENVPRSSGLEKFVYRAPNMFTLARWEIASLFGFFQKTDAVTPLPSYINVIESIVGSCISAGVTPVVLSPFVFGSRYSTRNAILYTKALHEIHSRATGMIIIDCIRLLTKFPRSQILLNDGFHLSIKAHNLIGEEIGKAIVADVVQADRHTSHP